MPIPKIIHIVWIGDEKKRPDECIETWRLKNPDYEVKVWGNDTLSSHSWHNGKHMQAMSRFELCGVADMMRYEILYNEGGIAVDADSKCLRGLEDWLLEPEAFAAWENELLRPGLIACGAIAGSPKNKFWGTCIKACMDKTTVTDERAWKTVGPRHLTEVYRKTKYPLTIYPSHFFYKTHHTGFVYETTGPCFADQFWGSTNGYENVN